MFRDSHIEFWRFSSHTRLGSRFRWICSDNNGATTPTCTSTLTHLSAVLWESSPTNSLHSGHVKAAVLCTFDNDVSLCLEYQLVLVYRCRQINLLFDPRRFLLSAMRRNMSDQLLNKLLLRRPLQLTVSSMGVDHYVALRRWSSECPFMPHCIAAFNQLHHSSN